MVLELNLDVQVGVRRRLVYLHTLNLNIHVAFILTFRQHTRLVPQRIHSTFVFCVYPGDNEFLH